MHKALHPRDDVDRLYEWKKEEEESAALKTASMHRYKNSKTTLKIQKTDYSDQKQYRQYKHQENKNNQKIKKKKKRKNNIMDISSDKHAKSHRRKLEHC